MSSLTITLQYENFLFRRRLFINKLEFRSRSQNEEGNFEETKKQETKKKKILSLALVLAPCSLSVKWNLLGSELHGKSCGRWNMVYLSREKIIDERRDVDIAHQDCLFWVVSDAQLMEDGSMEADENGSLNAGGPTIIMHATMPLMHGLFLFDRDPDMVNAN